jgi:hypothetical protein
VYPINGAAWSVVLPSVVLADLHDIEWWGLTVVPLRSCAVVLFPRTPGRTNCMI